MGNQQNGNQGNTRWHHNKTQDYELSDPASGNMHEEKKYSGILELISGLRVKQSSR